MKATTIHTNLGGDVDHVILGAPEAGWAEAIAVQARSNLAAVGEDEKGRAVPPLLQALEELIEINHLSGGGVGCMSFEICILKGDRWHNKKVTYDVHTSG